MRLLPLGEAVLIPVQAVPAVVLLITVAAEVAVADAVAVPLLSGRHPAEDHPLLRLTIVAVLLLLHGVIQMAVRVRHVVPHHPLLLLEAALVAAILLRVALHVQVAVIQVAVVLLLVHQVVAVQAEVVEDKYCV